MHQYAHKCQLKNTARVVQGTGLTSGEEAEPYWKQIKGMASQLENCAPANWHEKITHATRTENLRAMEATAALLGRMADRARALFLSSIKKLDDLLLTIHKHSHVVVDAPLIESWRRELHDESGSGASESFLSLRAELCDALEQKANLLRLSDVHTAALAAGHGDQHTEDELAKTATKIKSIEKQIRGLQKKDPDASGVPTSLERREMRAHKRLRLMGEISEQTALWHAVKGTFKRGKNFMHTYSSEKQAARKRLESIQRRLAFLERQLALARIHGDPIDDAVSVGGRVPELFKLQIINDLHSALRSIEELTDFLPGELAGFISTCEEDSAALEEKASELEGNAGFVKDSVDRRALFGDATAMRQQAAIRRAWGAKAKTLTLPVVPAFSNLVFAPGVLAAALAASPPLHAAEPQLRAPGCCMCFRVSCSGASGCLGCNEGAGGDRSASGNRQHSGGKNASDEAEKPPPLPPPAGSGQGGPHELYGVSYVPQSYVGQASGYAPEEGAFPNLGAVGRGVLVRCPQSDGSVRWRHGKVEGLIPEAVPGDFVQFNFGPGGVVGGTVSCATDDDEFMGFGGATRATAEAIQAVDFVDSSRLVLSFQAPGIGHAGGWAFCIASGERYECLANKTRVLWLDATGGQADLVLGALNFGASGDDGDPGSLSWFFVERREAVEATRLRRFTESEAAFKSKNGLTIQKESPDGWCGIRALYRQVVGAGLSSGVSATPTELRSTYIALSSALEGAAEAMATYYVTHVWGRDAPVGDTVDLGDDDDDEDRTSAPAPSRERNPQRRRENAHAKYAADVKSRAVLLRTPVLPSASCSFLADRRFWMEATWDLQAIAHCKKVRCVLVTHGQVEVKVYHPNCMISELNLSDISIEPRDIILLYNGVHFDSYLRCD
jgi:hypothetical protein